MSKLWPAGLNKRGMELFGHEFDMLALLSMRGMILTGRDCTEGIYSGLRLFASLRQ